MPLANYNTAISELRESRRVLFVNATNCGIRLAALAHRPLQRQRLLHLLDGYGHEQEADTYSARHACLDDWIRIELRCHSPFEVLPPIQCVA